MKHLNIRTACISLFCCAGILSASSGAVDTTPQERIVVQNYYYALPGKAEEVYQWRLHASEVRAKLGLPRGRVLRRMAQPRDPENLPDVIWECEYSSVAARSADVEKLGKSPEFDQVEKHMDTLIRHFERAIFELKD
jgi:hypothetical protein